ncbi:Pre-pilin like leader sequence [gamma proteobacterium HdN1]|nr:Pre-pilin like leader sequence [gamma proteobacterium HdN1]
MKRASAFTLTELLIVVAIISILSVIATPNLGKMLARQKQESLQQRFVDISSLARLAAIQNVSASVICGSSDGQQCNQEKVWTGRVLAFLDRDGDHQWSEGDQLLHQTLLGDGQISGTRSRIEFNQSGAGYMGSWLYCPYLHQNDRNGFRLILSLGGRLRTELASNACATRA